MRALFPLDGSDVSFRALERGLEILAGSARATAGAGASGLEVVLFNVRQPGFESAREDVVEQFDKDEEDEVFPTEDSSLRMLRRGLEIAQKLGIAASTKSVVGRPLETILAEAKSYDVMVIHALSKSSLRDLLTGSNSEKLVRESPTSVLVVRA